MKVSTRYKNKHITRKELKFSTAFMLAHLVDEDEHKRTHITTFSKKYEGNNNLCGLVIADKKNKFKFRIYLNPDLSRKRQLLTLAHELVHCKQFMRDELGQTIDLGDAVFTKWNNKMIRENDIDYDCLPWEIEATGREYGLYQRWTDYKNSEKLKFSQ